MRLSQWGLFLAVNVLVGVVLAGCGGVAAPTATLTPAPTNTALEVAQLPTASPTPAPTLPAAQVESPTPTLSPQPPTETPLPSPTPGPYEHTVAASDTLLYIIQLYGYSDLSTGPGSIASEVVALNDMISADILPPPGTVLFIPRQTATPTPANEATAVVAAATGTAEAPNVVFAANTSFFEYVVEDGDTIIAIAGQFGLTLEQIAQLNPDLNFSGCIFEIPSGGPRCIVPLAVGQSLRLPAPTPTPTFSPTPSGSETPTPTPTLTSLVLLFPPRDAEVAAGRLTLQWVGAGVLQPDQSYFVQVTDVTAGNTQFIELTRSTSLTLPESLIPASGQPHLINWTVLVVEPNGQGAFRPIGGPSEVRAFTWQSR
jgi:hypothetical protein